MSHCSQDVNQAGQVVSNTLQALAASHALLYHFWYSVGSRELCPVHIPAVPLFPAAVLGVLGAPQVLHSH